jgi:radical SAM protein with 4Fe4S-binding SPASM domain
METSYSSEELTGGLRDHVIRKYRESNRLMSAQFEVTHRCPCSCIHCYLRKPETEELDIDEIEMLFRQLAFEGVIELGITGGEPFARADIGPILQLTQNEKFLTTVQTSGVLLGSAEIELLHNTGVRWVEMSLLGGRPKTHDAAMRIEGAFKRISQAAEGLKEAGISVTLKGILLRENFDEWNEMNQVAKRLGASFSIGVLLAPTTDGNLSPQMHMITDEQAAQYAQLRDNPPAGNRLTCQAGRTSCSITPNGGILPCTLLRRKVGNIRRDLLQSIWHDRPGPFLTALRGTHQRHAAACYRCDAKSRCERCPGIAFMETGVLGAPSPAACRLAGVNCPL